MPLSLNVGVSKKLGLPNYGSVGASCNVTVELDAALLNLDPDGFHRHVRNAYTACARAVKDELTLHQPTTADPTRAYQHPLDGRNNGSPNGHHRTATGESSLGYSNDGRGVGNSQWATERQMNYIHQLARTMPGMGMARLESLAVRMFGKPLANLTNLDASSLIDTLKAIRQGQLESEQTSNNPEPSD